MPFGFGGRNRGRGAAWLPTALVPGGSIGKLLIENMILLDRAPKRPTAAQNGRPVVASSRSSSQKAAALTPPQPARRDAGPVKPQRDGRFGSAGVRDALGKVWNAPNSLIGVAYGSLGHAVGETIHAVHPKYPRPGIVIGDNLIQFRDNPAGGVSAITIGNASIHAPGFDRPDDVNHEKQHSYQGELLGPAYLPMNVAGGLTAMLLDGEWHGDHNWMERGPQMKPPRPWARGKAP